MANLIAPVATRWQGKHGAKCLPIPLDLVPQFQCVQRTRNKKASTSVRRCTPANLYLFINMNALTNRNHLGFIITLLAIVCASAQNREDVKPTPSHVAALEELLETTKIKEQYEKNLNALIETPDIGAFKKVRDVVLHELSWETFKPEVIELYAQDLTEEEARDSIPLFADETYQTFLNILLSPPTAEDGPKKDITPSHQALLEELFEVVMQKELFTGTIQAMYGPRFPAEKAWETSKQATMEFYGQLLTEKAVRDTLPIVADPKVQAVLAMQIVAMPKTTKRVNAKFQDLAPWITWLFEEEMKKELAPLHTEAIEELFNVTRREKEYEVSGISSLENSLGRIETQVPPALRPKLRKAVKNISRQIVMEELPWKAVKQQAIRLYGEKLTQEQVLHAIPLMRSKPYQRMLDVAFASSAGGAQGDVNLEPSHVAALEELFTLTGRKKIHEMTVITEKSRPAPPKAPWADVKHRYIQAYGRELTEKETRDINRVLADETLQAVMEQALELAKIESWLVTQELQEMEPLMTKLLQAEMNK